MQGAGKLQLQLLCIFRRKEGSAREVLGLGFAFVWSLAAFSTNHIFVLYVGALVVTHHASLRNAAGKTQLLKEHQAGALVRLVTWHQGGA